MRLSSFVLRLIARHLIIDFGHDYRDVVFVAGSARSGTTWLSNIINYKNEYRYVFEPFRKSKVAICRGFRDRQYLRPDNRDAAFLIPAESILRGKVRSRWIDAHNRKIVSQRRLIKDIRANLLLKWMYVTFTGVPIILLLRHPCAVASSRLRQQWDPTAVLRDTLGQADLLNDFLYPFRTEIERANTVFEKLIFLWCIENYVPLKQFKPGEVCVVFYEDLCRQPRRAIARLFLFLGKEVEEPVYAVLSEPSSTSAEWSAILSKDDVVNAWRKVISDEMTKRAGEILSLFGLERLYSSGAMPCVENPDVDVFL